MKHVLNSRRSFIRKTAAVISGCLVSDVLNAAIAKKPVEPVDLGFISEKMALMRRTEWTDVQPKPMKMRAGGNYSRLTIHHTGQSPIYSRQKNAVIHDLDGVITGHLKKNYGDIAYHFIIDIVGRVWEGRSLSYEGAHVSDENENNIGIMVLGNFESQKPSEKHIESMTKLTDLLREKYVIKKHRIYGHRDLGASACPGKHLYSAVKKIKE